MRSAVEAATPYNIPVTCKFRIGISDDIITYLETGVIAAEEGMAAIALHARTAEQHYGGIAQWDAITQLKREVSSIPVLGNGDVWEAHDAIRMMEETGCDGVVVGRGALGRPWLFRDLVDAFEGREVQRAPQLGFVMDIMCRHAELLCEHMGHDAGIRNFRKHAGWYLTGYPVGTEARRAFSMVTSLEELVSRSAQVDRDAVLVLGGERMKRGHTNGPIKVVLPDGYLENRDDMTIPEDGAVVALSGG
jgi:nifR3 family TIM-barrel protein